MILFLPATTRVVLGVEQIWLMVELIERIDSSTRMLEISDSFVSSRVQRQKRWVKIGRVCVTAVNLFFLLAICTCCFLIKWKTDKKLARYRFKVLQYTFDGLFAALFFALTIVVIILIKKLKANNRTLVESVRDSNYFKNEINTLSFILFFFAVSYLLRVAYDSTIGFTIR